MHLRKTAALLLASMISVAAHADSDDDSGALELSEFTSEATKQGSTVLIPSGSSRSKRPVLILLPFTGGTARELLEWYYAASLPQQAAVRGFIIVMPRARGSAEDYSTGSAWAATLDRYTGGVRADAEEITQRFDADPARIVLAGYSMGGDLSWALIQRDPERYAGAIIMGSRATYRAKGALERLAQRGVRVFTFMGKSETSLRIAGMDAARAELKRAGVTHRAASASGEHVPAPRDIFEEAVDFTLGYTAGISSPTSEPRASLPPEPTRPVSSEIVERLPACDWQPFEDSASGKYGYKNSRGKIVVPARFDTAESFGADGLAGIHENGRFGYIACSGKTFSVMGFDNGPDRFAEGLARFEENGRVGFTNRRGEAVIPARHESAQPFCRKLAQIGSDCNSSQRGEYSILECAKQHYIDHSGRKVPTPENPPVWPNCEVAQSQEIVERLPACGWKPFLDKASKLYGYRDAKGKVVVEPRYDVAEPFGADGLAYTRVSNFGVGYLTCEGKAFEVLYDGGPDTFQDGLVRVEGENYDIGYRNRRGDLVIPADYSFGTPFCGGVAKVGKGCTTERGDNARIVNVECSSWQYIDRSGKPVPQTRVTKACADRVTEPRLAGDAETDHEDEEEPETDEDESDEEGEDGEETEEVPVKKDEDEDEE